MSERLGPSAEILKALETAPNMYLILSPDLYIITASDAYLNVIETTRDVIINRHIFDAFPDNPDLADGDDGLKNINASLQAVLRTKKPDYMRIQRYDVPDRQNPGKFIARYWDPSHTPVLDENGEIAYIIQLATNVTDRILTERALLKSQQEQVETLEQMKLLNNELLHSNIELRETQNHSNNLNVQLEERVQRRTKELAASEERYKQKFNEEQALNEELAASNDEQAAVNEKLSATNEELYDTQQQLQKVNNELESNTSRLRMAIESTQLGTWDLNPVTRKLYWSKECRDIYGIPQDLEATFDIFLSLIHPDDRDWVKEQISASIDPAEKSAYDLIYRVNRYDNQQTRWIKAKGTVYFDHDNATRFIGTIFDITEIKLAQEESSKLAAIIASSEDAIVSKTLDSTITSWNRSAERMFGWTAEEMIGHSMYQLIPEDRQQEEPLLISQLKSGERIEHFETKRMTKDGQSMDVSVSISPIRNKEGQIVGLSNISRDITERKQDERRKNDFIGMVSHELKTPLTSLNGYLQMLQTKEKQDPGNFTVRAVEQSLKQVKRMTNLINGFLNVTRLESGKIHIDRTVFDMADLVIETNEETHMLYEGYHFVFHPVEPTLVNADQDKIGQVINNLISNAVKYSRSGSTIEIACVQVGNTARVSVSDKGIGIKKEDLDKLFERYYRVSNNNLISGFGIGLYLSAEIINRHGGKIWAVSEPDKGSVFYFSLPLYRSAADVDL